MVIQQRLLQPSSPSALEQPLSAHHACVRLMDTVALGVRYRHGFPPGTGLFPFAQDCSGKCPHADSRWANNPTDPRLT